jgi:hypothetical protein
MSLAPMNSATSPAELTRSVELGVMRFLAQFPSTSRAEALHLALQTLSARMEPDKVLGCELAWEVHIHSYWSLVRRDNGTAYESEEAYFREVLRLTSWRTAYKRLAIGRVLTSFGESERAPADGDCRGGARESDRGGASNRTLSRLADVARGGRLGSARSRFRRGSRRPSRRCHAGWRPVLQASAFVGPCSAPCRTSKRWSSSSSSSPSAPRLWARLIR